MIQRIILLLCFCLLSGCGGGSSDPSPSGNAKDRKAMLAFWADEIIIPSYDNFKDALLVMDAAADNFVETPDVSSLSTFRAAWSDAYLLWQTVELFEFGPAERNTLRNFSNIYPTDVNAILANIQNPSASLEVASSYAAQGFPALDYLLYGVGETDGAVVDYYSTHADAEKNKAYVLRLVARLVSLTTQVVTEWETYRDTFVSKTSLDMTSSTGLAVNAYSLHYERFIRTGKIGIPSGATVASSGVPYPEKREAYYQGAFSKALAVRAHEACVNFFNGVSVLDETAGPSLQSYLDALGAKDDASGKMLSTLINEQVEVIADKLSSLSDDFAAQIETDNQAMIDTHTEMQKLVRMIKVDMASAMSITITYTDNDGD